MKKKKGVDGKHSQWTNTSSSSSVLQIQSMSRCHVNGEFQVFFRSAVFPINLADSQRLNTFFFIHHLC